MYEFGDFSFIKVDSEYYNMQLFYSIIEKYDLWDDLKNFENINEIKLNNLYLLFKENYFKDKYLEFHEFSEYIEEFLEIIENGWIQYVNKYN